MQFRTVKLRRDPKCPACGTRELKQLADYEQFCGIRGQVDDTAGVPALTPKELQARLARHDDFDLVERPRGARVGHLPDRGARLAPLSTFADALRTLDSARTWSSTAAAACAARRR